MVITSSYSISTNGCILMIIPEAPAFTNTIELTKVPFIAAMFYAHR